MKRRQFIGGCVACSSFLSAMKPLHAGSRAQDFKPARIHMPQTVRAPVRHPKGTIVVDPHEMFLYYMYGNGRARRYGVGVGHAGAAWSGTATVERKVEWPSWMPTNEMIARDPAHYAKFANGVPGGEANPLGARALYLFNNGKDTLYRIHGTNAPWTIGTASSNGCIRMINEHVIDLYNRTEIGAKVIVL